MSGHPAEKDRHVHDFTPSVFPYGWCSCGTSLKLPDLLAQAWDQGYLAGQSFGYEYAQDTYDGPSEDPTPNPYAT